jgi:hypothetical protein
MVSAAVINQALGGNAAGPTLALWIEGINVLKQPGTAANRYGIPQETIRITEAGPDDVSSMTAVIEDPSLSLPTFSDFAPVGYWDLVNNRPFFTGWIQNAIPRPFGLGRAYDITCVGPEAALDWMVVPSLTIPAGTQIHVAVQAACGAAIGVGVPLRAFHVESKNGGQTAPIGNLSLFGDDLNAPVTGVAVVADGDTLREVLRKIVDAAPNMAQIGADFEPIVAYGAITVDFYLGVRLYSSGEAPSDYDPLTVSDTVGGAIAAARIKHERASLGIYRTVYIKGGNAAGTGLVTDGSGKPGKIAVIPDSTITTSAARDIAGQAYLARQSQGARGELDIETFIPSTNVKAGSRVVITDAQLGLSSADFRIASIVKRFEGPTQSWQVQYGKAQPSAARLVRALTRTPVS